MLNKHNNLLGGQAIAAEVETERGIHGSVTELIHQKSEGTQIEAVLMANLAFKTRIKLALSTAEEWGEIALRIVASTTKLMPILYTPKHTIPLNLLTPHLHINPSRTLCNMGFSNIEEGKPVGFKTSLTIKLSASRTTINTLNHHLE